MILQEYISNVSSVTIIYIYIREYDSPRIHSKRLIGNYYIYILGNMILQEYISNVSSVTIIYIY